MRRPSESVREAREPSHTASQTYHSCPTRALAQCALRLEEIHQSLRANVLDTAHHMQVDQVARSIQHVRKSNASIQKQLVGLKQRVRALCILSI
jgi:hypothetical protein